MTQETMEANARKGGNMETLHRFVKHSVKRGYSPVVCMTTEERAKKFVEDCEARGVNAEARANKHGVWYVMVGNEAKKDGCEIMGNGKSKQGKSSGKPGNT